MCEAFAYLIGCQAHSTFCKWRLLWYACELVLAMSTPLLDFPGAPQESADAHSRAGQLFNSSSEERSTLTPAAIVEYLDRFIVGQVGFSLTQCEHRLGFNLASTHVCVPLCLLCLHGFVQSPAEHCLACSKLGLFRKIYCHLQPVVQIWHAVCAHAQAAA